MDVSYQLTGSFLETCDCAVICPCWVDEEPDGGHCTGLVAWSLGAGSTIDGTPVAGRTVVSVSTHAQARGVGGTSTVLFVDDAATDAERAILVTAFSGGVEGPLADIARVTGDVILSDRAAIEITTAADGAWTISVKVAAGNDAAQLVGATGSPTYFDDNAQPMTLNHTALHHELGARSTAVTAQRAAGFKVAIPSLPGGYVEVAASSGMTGSFSYSHDAGS